MSICECCYCLTKNKPDNPEYIRGIQFATDWLSDEWCRLQEFVDRNRKANREGEMSDKMLKIRIQNVEHEMRYLGKLHNVLAKEGNKSIKLIKDIDWQHYLYEYY